MPLVHRPAPVAGGVIVVGPYILLDSTHAFMGDTVPSCL